MEKDKQDIAYLFNFQNTYVIGYTRTKHLRNEFEFSVTIQLRSPIEHSISYK